MIILFIILIYYILKGSRVEEQKKLSIKSNCFKKIKGLTYIKGPLFCSKKCLSFLIASKINNNFITFNNFAMAENFLKLLTNAGFNLNKPIYKLEFYTKDYLLNKKSVTNSTLNHKKQNSKNNKCQNKLNKYHIKTKTNKYGKYIGNKENKYNYNIKKKQEKNNNKIELKQKEHEYILQQIYKTLSAINYLKQYNMLANYLIFIDDETIYKSVLKLVNYFKLNIKIYVKNEIDYKLLGAINYLNINTSAHQNYTCNNVCYNTNFHNQINLKSNYKFRQSLDKKFYNNNLNKITLNSNKIAETNQFVLSVKDQNFCFKNFEYSNYYLSDNIKNNLLFSTLSVTQNYQLNALIFKLDITNITNSNLDVNFNFLYSIPHKIAENAVYFIDSSKTHIYLLNKINLNNAFLLIGNFNNYCINKYNILTKKNFKIPPKKMSTFYFLVSANSQNISFNNTKNLHYNISQNLHNNIQSIIEKNNDGASLKLIKNYIKKVERNLEIYYQNSDYNNLNLIKILTQNKTLNLLVNQYYPQRIIKNYIVNSFYFSLTSLVNNTTSVTDFYCLKNNVFDLKLIDNYFVINNLNALFLLKDNLYKVYLNLVYFKLGFFASLNGLNINQNKTQIVDRAVVSLKHYNNLTINVDKVNLNNEIQIDKIKYTNLNFLKIETKTKNLHLQF